MIDEAIQSRILEIICELKARGEKVVLVHGGGPFIKRALQNANIESEFIDGQRVTSAEALVHIEATLKGQVNSQLVGLINRLGQKAVGLSGKDGKIAIARKRFGKATKNGAEKQVDLGFVGEISHVNAELLWLMLDHDYIPVITCLGADEEGNTYNINGDVFAGKIAGALGAREFIVLTDVDGLLEDIKRKESLIKEVTIEGIHELTKKGIIQGGMIPKMEACITALQKGAEQVRIINGTKPEQLLELMNGQSVGTVIKP